jgi:hypothetical protein
MMSIKDEFAQKDIELGQREALFAGDFTSRVVARDIPANVSF